MYIISLIGQKGGTGKTTAALGLAVAAAKAGETVAIIDLDPQATAARWKDRREAESPAVISAQASRLIPTLEAAKKMKVQFAVIDTAGRNDDSALSAARAADIVIIPTRPNMVEIETLAAVKDLISIAGNPPAFVLLNGIHPTATKQAEEARQTIKQAFGFESLKVHLCHRSAYAEAPTSGLTPQELDSEGKAAIELMKLYQNIKEFLDQRNR